MNIPQDVQTSVNEIVTSNKNKPTQKVKIARILTEYYAQNIPFLGEPERQALTNVIGTCTPNWNQTDRQDVVSTILTNIRSWRREIAPRIPTEHELEQQLVSSLSPTTQTVLEAPPIQPQPPIIPAPPQPITPAPPEPTTAQPQSITAPTITQATTEVSATAQPQSMVRTAIKTTRIALGTLAFGLLANYIYESLASLPPGQNASELQQLRQTAASAIGQGALAMAATIMHFFRPTIAAQVSPSTMQPQNPLQAAFTQLQDRRERAEFLVRHATPAQLREVFGEFTQDQALQSFEEVYILENDTAQPENIRQEAQRVFTENFNELRRRVIGE